jgi:hypothetical protein
LLTDSLSWSMKTSVMVQLLVSAGRVVPAKSGAAGFRDGGEARRPRFNRRP